MSKEELSEKVKRYRLARLWTIEQMATVTGLSVGTISNIENQVNDPHDLTVAKLLRALPDLEAA